MRRVEVKKLAQVLTDYRLLSPRSAGPPRGYRLCYQYETGRTFHQHCEAI